MNVQIKNKSIRIDSVTVNDGSSRSLRFVGNDRKSVSIEIDGEVVINKNVSV